MFSLCFSDEMGLFLVYYLFRHFQTIILIWQHLTSHNFSILPYGSTMDPYLLTCSFWQLDRGTCIAESPVTGAARWRPCPGGASHDWGWFLHFILGFTRLPHVFFYGCEWPPNIHIYIYNYHIFQSISKARFSSLSVLKSVNWRWKHIVKLAAKLGWNQSETSGDCKMLPLVASLVPSTWNNTSNKKNN